ncbi:MAG: hypothetical protein ACRDKS_13690 [Actinomycetota bacterium]
MRTWVLIATAALLVPACGGGTHLKQADLAKIMPSAADAPAATQLDTSNVGVMTLEQLVTDNAVRAELKKLHYRVGYVATFATPNYIPDAAKAPLGSALYATSAIVFQDTEDARRGFAFYEKRLRSRADDFAPLLMKGIGEELIAFRFSSLDDTPLPGLAIQWRRGNALFSVVGVGNPGPMQDIVKGLARTIDERARKA